MKDHTHLLRQKGSKITEVMDRELGLPIYTRENEPACFPNVIAQIEPQLRVVIQLGRRLCQKTASIFMTKGDRMANHKRSFLQNKIRYFHHHIEQVRVGGEGVDG